MKNWKYIVWAFFVLLGTACEEIALPATALIVQENKADVLYTSATLTIKLEPTAATIQAMNVYYSLSSNMSDSQKMAMKKVDEFTYTAVLVNLKEETTYYVQYEALNAFSSTKDKNTYDFKTKKQVILPTVVTSAVTQITVSSAVMGGNITSDGGATVTERGVVYSTSQNPDINDINNFICPCGSGTGEFTYTATTLKSNTTYYVRAYAKNEKGTAYGAEVRFTTNNQVVVPTVTTTAATQVTETTAVTGGNVTSDGGATVTERGVVYSTSHNPTTSNSKVKNGTGTGSFTCNLTGLQANTTYYVRAYAVNSKGTSYGTEVSFTTKSSSSSDHTGTENGHEYVDLGLSVKWATFNVGATKPEEYGDYFAWGETTTKSVYGWSTYNWCNGTSSTLTKYNTSNIYGTVDQKTKLELSDDAARVNWGGKWRMPTYDEFLELREKCTWKWTTQNGVKGYMITNNGNSMFLPAAGYRYESSLINAGSLGYYWSSSLETGIPYYAWYMELNSIMEEEGSHRGNRSAGRSVRPVCP